MYAHIYTHHAKGERRRCAPERYKKTAETRKNLIRNFPARKLKTEKNARKRRKRNHQSTIKFVIFTGGMTNNAPENSHRRHIFFRDSRYFLCFPLGKRRSPLWKTYVSRQENLRFPHWKHRKHKGKERLSCRHFQNTKHRKEQTDHLQGKQSEGKLTENQEDKSGLKNKKPHVRI